MNHRITKNPELDKRDELRQARELLSRALDSLANAATERAELRAEVERMKPAVAFVRAFADGERGSREVDYDDAAEIVERLDRR